MEAEERKLKGEGEERGAWYWETEENPATEVGRLGHQFCAHLGPSDRETVGRDGNGR